MNFVFAYYQNYLHNVYIASDKANSCKVISSTAQRCIKKCLKNPKIQPTSLEAIPRYNVKTDS